MARIPVTREQVFEVADAITKKGSYPNVDTVRLYLGHGLGRGSGKKIWRFLSEWEELLHEQKDMSVLTEQEVRFVRTILQDFTNNCSIKELHAATFGASQHVIDAIAVTLLLRKHNVLSRCLANKSGTFDVGAKHHFDFESTIIDTLLKHIIEYQEEEEAWDLGDDDTFFGALHSLLTDERKVDCAWEIGRLCAIRWLTEEPWSLPTTSQDKGPYRPQIESRYERWMGHWPPEFRNEWLNGFDCGYDDAQRIKDRRRYQHYRHISILQYEEILELLLSGASPEAIAEFIVFRGKRRDFELLNWVVEKGFSRFDSGMIDFVMRTICESGRRSVANLAANVAGRSLTPEEICTLVYATSLNGDVVETFNIVEENKRPLTLYEEDLLIEKFFEYRWIPSNDEVYQEEHTKLSCYHREVVANGIIGAERGTKEAIGTLIWWNNPRGDANKQFRNMLVEAEQPAEKDIDAQITIALENGKRKEAIKLAKLGASTFVREKILEKAKSSASTTGLDLAIEAAKLNGRELEIEEIAKIGKSCAEAGNLIYWLRAAVYCGTELSEEEIREISYKYVNSYYPPGEKYIFSIAGFFPKGFDIEDFEGAPEEIAHLIVDGKLDFIKSLYWTDTEAVCRFAKKVLVLMQKERKKSSSAKLTPDLKEERIISETAKNGLDKPEPIENNEEKGEVDVWSGNIIGGLEKQSEKEKKAGGCLISVVIAAVVLVLFIYL